MKWTGLNEIREKYLSFFESKGHTRMPSASLVPVDDNSLLLINSGMAPLKKFFLGQATPPNKRVATCQKCIRTPDIENVGKTARHGTFFEMLGNFSFGDYFKVEAIQWAWEFMTEVMEFPKELLWVTVYLDDDEAHDIWRDKIGIPEERIVRLGKEDNFWEIGSGPCGPCSEIYVDRGEKYGCGEPDCKPGCDCDRYIEVWNIVFSQFDGDGKGNYTPVAHPNIDTGMGLERMACVLQNVENLFEVDTIFAIIKKIEEITGTVYKEDPHKDVSIRVITDHARSAAFMVSDGVIPSNEGRGYVLRRLIRRAARHGRLLGVGDAFLSEIVKTVIAQSKDAYPNLKEQEDYILKVISIEEERFSKTIDAGIQMLNHIVDNIEGQVAKIGERFLDPETAFKLYDTFGFPIDLTKEILAERNILLEEEKFKELMNRQREMARRARANLDTVGWVEEDRDEIETEATDFVGYSKLQTEATITAILVEGKNQDCVESGSTVQVVLDQTPFYPEGGGQVADTGVISFSKNTMEVKHCQKDSVGHYLHTATVTSGFFSVGDKVLATVNKSRRNDIMRNHTAAHLLQAALRKVLGDHVHQAGSFVDENRMRFDFTHFDAVTSEELKQVEELINGYILETLPMVCEQMSMEEAKQKGAMALFGEKYGDSVRVCTIGDNVSVELCGGTHVQNTSELGLFKILSEASVSAGVRRIEGVTGKGVLAYIAQADEMTQTLVKTLKVNAKQDILPRIHTFIEDNREKERKIVSLTGKLASYQVDSMLEKAVDIKGEVKLVVGVSEGTTPDTLKTIADQIKDKGENYVVFLVGTNKDKGNFLVSLGKKALEGGYNAGIIVKELAAMAGGRGGGRPDSAMAGLKNLDAIDRVLSQAKEVIEGTLKG